MTDDDDPTFILHQTRGALRAIRGLLAAANEHNPLDQCAAGDLAQLVGLVADRVELGEQAAIKQGEQLAAFRAVHVDRAGAVHRREPG